MGGPPGSQVVPYPTNLPFRVISKTIGSGAYAAIRKATPLHCSSPVIAVKFINKAHAYRVGHLRPKQLQIELSLHKQVSGHANVVRFLSFGEDEAWVWLCLELAEGGDLFDKIEADAGVGEDVAHFYFTQLVAAIGWCHGRGVAHRDIKPENMLLAGDGNLKLADFGLATQFLDVRSGARKRCAMVCGSPPYIAPEIFAVGRANAGKRKAEATASYDPQGADVWSCAIVLFVLLAGNTPWDSPDSDASPEYAEYIEANGRVGAGDELWDSIPAGALSLLRGALRVDESSRFTLSDVRMHPWFTRTNGHLDSKGQAAQPLQLATEMLESLRIDFSQQVPASQQSNGPSASQGDAMDVDETPADDNRGWTRFAATQPDTGLTVESGIFDWEAPPRLAQGISSSQPLANNQMRASDATLYAALADDPSMSQFAATPSVPMTLTQAARQFKDIVPSHTLARFVSAASLPELLALLLAALHRLSIPVPAELASSSHANASTPLTMRIKTTDARKQPLAGIIVVEDIGLAATPHGGHGVGGTNAGDVYEVRFQKHKGDPLGWRRLFKQIAVLCKDVVLVPPSW